MISDLTLYWNTEILTNKNFKIDSIADYLATKTKQVISRFQYIKHQLFTTIKIDMNQSNLDYLQVDNIDYLSIQNYTEDVSPKEALVYYFVLRKRWLSQSTIALDLYQDTINSFDGKYTLSDKTKVIREHKDRWYKNPTTYSDTQSFTITTDYAEVEDYNLIIEFSLPTTLQNVNSIDEPDLGTDIESFTYSLNNIAGVWYGSLRIVVSTDNLDISDLPITIDVVFKYNQIYRIIDEYPEGITPLLLKQKEDVVLEGEIKWYLVYQNDPDDSNNPVAIFLSPSRDLSISQSGSYAITESAFTNNQFMEFAEDMNPNQLKVIINNVAYSPTIEWDDDAKVYHNIKIIHNSVDPTKLNVWVVKLYCTLHNGEWHVDWSSDREIAVGISSLQIEYADGVCYYYLGDTASQGYTIPRPINSSLAPTLTPRTLSSIKDTNRSLKKYVKIIELPYSPIPYSFDEYGNFILGNEGTIVSFDDDGDGVDSYRIELDKDVLLDGIYTNIRDNEIDNPLSHIFDSIGIPALTDVKDISRESKLYSSEFFNPKFVYDSFSYIFRLEAQNSSLLQNTDYFEFIFKPTNTIHSRFLFKFNQEKLKISREDYDSILIVNRNNELPIYTNDYLDYIRSGYNFDVKNKEISEFATILGAGLGVVGGVGSIGVSIATGNVASSVGGIASVVSSIAGAINTIAKNELSLEQKIQEKRLKATSVQGADDIDLLSYYANNDKAKICYYQPTERMRNLLFDLFYYCGYATQEYKIPTLNTRKWFNYIQADVVFKTSYNLPEDVLEDIKQRYAIGITCLHKVNGSWDFTQTKENWEVSIIG